MRKMQFYEKFRHLYPEGWEFIPSNRDFKIKYGRINDSPYQVKPFGGRLQCPVCDRHKSMFQRCHGGSDPTYGDCEVDPVWLKHSQFAKWFLPELDKFEIGSKLYLDKDIFGNGLKLYSPGTTCLITNEINTFIRFRENSGVRQVKTGYLVQCCRQGFTSRHVGTFKTREEATEVWIKTKCAEIKNINFPDHWSVSKVKQAKTGIRKLIRSCHEQN